MEFSNGDIVQLSDSKSEGIFTVSQNDPDRRRCWIGDDQGRGWYVYYNQIELVNDEED